MAHDADLTIDLGHDAWDAVDSRHGCPDTVAVVACGRGGGDALGALEHRPRNGDAPATVARERGIGIGAPAGRPGLQSIDAVAGGGNRPRDPAWSGAQRLNTRTSCPRPRLTDLAALTSQCFQIGERPQVAQLCPGC